MKADDPQNLFHHPTLVSFYIVIFRNVSHSFSIWTSLLRCLIDDYTHIGRVDFLTLLPFVFQFINEMIILCSINPKVLINNALEIFQEAIHIFCASHRIEN